MNRREFLQVTGISLTSASLATTEAKAAQAHRPLIFRFGLNGLDRATKFQPGELAVVLGPAASGKTLLLCGSAKHCVRDHGTLVFYNDEDAQGVTAERLRLNAAEADRLIVGTSWLQWADGKTLQQARNGLVIIDGGGWVDPCPANRRQTLLNLKRLAVERECGVIFAITTNRQPIGEVTHVKDETRDHLRLIDLLISCYKDGVPGGPPTVLFQVLKNQHGPQGGNVFWSHRVNANLALDPESC
jgi:hypothetical protein